MNGKDTNSVICGESLAECLFELVQRSIRDRRANLSVNVEFYIVELLKKFHNVDSLDTCLRLNSGEKPMTVLLLEALQSSFEEKIRKLRNIGDSTLVLAGFFEESLCGGIVAPDYYAALGKNAYSNLSSLRANEPHFSELFSELSEKFLIASRVLSDVAPWNHAISQKDIVRLYEKWLKTGDEKIKAILTEAGLKVE